jgi:hypothetical protein
MCPGASATLDAIELTALGPAGHDEILPDAAIRGILISQSEEPTTQC